MTISDNAGNTNQSYGDDGDDSNDDDGDGNNDDGDDDDDCGEVDGGDDQCGRRVMMAMSCAPPALHNRGDELV